MNVLNKIASINESEYSKNVKGTKFSYEEIFDFIKEDSKREEILSDLNVLSETNIEEMNNYLKLVALGMESILEVEK